MAVDGYRLHCAELATATARRDDEVSAAEQSYVDGVATLTADVSKAVAGFVYDVIDQKVVDGAVNGVGFTAEEGGSILRYIQTGRVQQYAAVLFGTAIVFGAVLVLTV